MAGEGSLERWFPGLRSSFFGFCLFLQRVISECGWMILCSWASTVGLSGACFCTSNYWQLVALLGCPIFFEPSVAFTVGLAIAIVGKELLALQCLQECRQAPLKFLTQP